MNAVGFFSYFSHYLIHLTQRVEITSFSRCTQECKQTEYLYDMERHRKIRNKIKTKILSVLGGGGGVCEFKMNTLPCHGKRKTVYFVGKIADCFFFHIFV